MKIAIIGYGRMGHAVEQEALKRGHEIVCVIDLGGEDLFESEEFRSADVAIEFSVPAAGRSNVSRAMEAGVPVVCGTTGWLDGEALSAMRDACAAGGSLLHSSNFSPGVNITMAASRLLARLLGARAEYSVGMEETHHIHKLDHPSGTAITIADQICAEAPRYDRWMDTTGVDAPVPHDAIPIECRREGEVPGMHTVTWQGPSDIITLRHEALNRDGFALGAVLAAEWLAKAPRGHVYSMADVLGIHS